ncbi:MAG: sulfoxide reductase heme-binding subunit YedZ [Gammaproteobacteria bacterium]|jgi:sulfoxide reductase heme-binding subunit YedZ
MGKFDFWLKPIVFVLCTIPALNLIYAGFHGGLGPNPVETITHATGEWALRMLLVTLAITPLRKLTALNTIMRMRRMFGLFVFFYVSAHLLTYAWLDAFFDPAYIWDDIAKRLYITVGFAGFCLLLPLALTSTNAMIRRLGAKRWQRLHRLVYAAALAGVLHFWWLVKADVREPFIYAAILAILMLARAPPIASRLRQIRAATS